MAAPASTEEFLDLVRKSGVTDDRRFTDYVSRNRAANALAPDASRMAGLLVRDGILTQFQAEQILLGKWRRFTIGKYKVLERLGAGGMGSVYLCEHKLMRRRVAVKVLPTAKAADQSALERFYREARAVAALDHPNIVHAYDIDQDDQLHFLVMEYVDGVNLQDMVKKSGPIDILRACHYIRQSALGLDHAHQAGLVHRDIKPGNILVDRGGTVKILDMGLARFFNDEDDILTKKFDENVLGTADYLAPEQAIDSHSVDIRADIYSLGATFYFLLTGRTPFGEGTVAQKLLWHQTRQPKLVSEYRKDVPPALVALIGKMMDKEPANRFQTPGELADALAPFTVTPIPPPPDSEMPTLSPAASGSPPPDLGADTAVSMKQEAPVPKALQGMSQTAMGKSGSGVKPSHAVDTASNAAAASLTPPVSPVPKRKSHAAEPEAQFTLADEPSPRLNLPTPRKSPGSSISGGSIERTIASAASAEPRFEPTADFVPVKQSPISSKKGLKPHVGSRAKLSPRLLLIVGGGLVLVALVVVLISVFALRPIAKTPDAPTRKPFEISANSTGKDSPFQFRKVGDALRSKKLKKGDVILLNDENHEEHLDIDMRQISSFPIDVVIRPAPGKSVTWTTSQKARLDLPALSLKHAAGLKFEGPNLTIDGKLDAADRLEYLVDLTGSAPGLTFDNVSFRSFQLTAIQITNADGDKNSPIVFKDCEFASDPAEKLKPGQKTRSAATFRIDPRRFPVMNDYISFADCKFTGLKTPFVALDPKTPAVGPNVAGVTLSK